MQEEAVLKKVGWSALIISVLTGALGAALISRPEDVQRLMAMILAAICAALGVYHLILYFVSQRKKSMLATDLFCGVIFLVLGAFLYIRRADVMNYITYIFGLVLIVNCILEFQNAIFVKRLGYTNWLMVLFFGAVTLVFAVLLILHPQMILNSLMLFSGIFLIAAGATGIISFIFLRVAMHQAKKALKNAPAEAAAVDADEVWTGDDAADGVKQYGAADGAKQYETTDDVKQYGTADDVKPYGAGNDAGAGSRADDLYVRDAEFTEVPADSVPQESETAGPDEHIFDVDATQPIRFDPETGKRLKK